MDSLRWYKLDNVAKLFPAVTTKTNSSTFRVSFIFNENITPKVLQEALDSVILRFPMFSVRLRKGLFWYFLEHNDEKLLVFKESDAPCSNIDRYENNDFLIRVLYYNKKLSIEFFHSITDGFGAFEFLKVLSYKYLELLGYSFESNNEILSLLDLSTQDEADDCFKKYFIRKKSNPQKTNNAYKITGTHFNNFGNNIIKINLNTAELKAICKNMNITITEYVVSLFIYSIATTKNKDSRKNRPINIFVPVNLRRLFPSITLRNFFSVVNISVLPSGDISFSDIIKKVSEQFKLKIDKEVLLDDLIINYKIERNFLIRISPLMLKNLFLKIAFMNGTKQQTSTVSNIGAIKLPAEMYSHINHSEMVLYSSRKIGINCGMSSLNDILTITFTRTIKEPEIIKNFVDHLSKIENFKLEVISNDWGIHDE